MPSARTRSRNKLAKSVIADGGGNTTETPKRARATGGVDAIAAGGELNVLKRLARSRWGKTIHRSGQDIGHGIAHTKDFTGFFIDNAHELYDLP